MREHRARAELERARLLVEDGESGDVGRLKVGRALNPRERRASDTAAIERDRTVFAVPGTSSNRTWPPGDQRSEHEPNLVGLSVHDVLDVLDQARRDRHGLSEPLV